MSINTGIFPDKAMVMQHQPLQKMKTHEDYVAMLEQYKDTPYYDYLVNNNPWDWSKQNEFQPTFWQSLGESLGDFSSRNQYYQGLQEQQNQWVSNHVEAMRQQEYNEPINQVQRNAAAGINSNLAPSSINPGSAAENDQPSTSVSWPSESDIQNVGQVGLSFISNLIGIAQSFQGLKQGSNSLIHQELSNNEQARDFVINMLAGSSKFKDTENLDIEPNTIVDVIKDSAKSIDSAYSGYSPGTRKLMKRMLRSYQRDIESGRSPMAVESLKSELRNKIASNNKSAASIAGNPMFDEDFNKFIRNIAEVIGPAEYKLQVSEYNSRIAKAGFDSKFFHHLNAETAATAENESNKARSVESSQKSIVEGMWNDIYKICKDSNSWYGTIGLVLIPFLRSMASNLSIGAGRYGKDGKFGITGINL